MHNKSYFNWVELENWVSFLHKCFYYVNTLRSLFIFIFLIFLGSRLTEGLVIRVISAPTTLVNRFPSVYPNLRHDLIMWNIINRYLLQKKVRLFVRTYDEEFVMRSSKIKYIRYDLKDKAVPSEGVMNDWFRHLERTYVRHKRPAVAIQSRTNFISPFLVALTYMEQGMEYVPACDYIDFKLNGNISFDQYLYLATYVHKGTLHPKFYSVTQKLCGNMICKCN